MTIGDIARRTFIQPKFLHAIDEDNLGVIPDSHRRPFIREYARVVGVEADEVLSLLADYEPPPAPAVAEQHVPQRRFDMEEQNVSAPVPPALDESDRRAYGEILRRLSAGRGMKLSGSNLSSWLITGAFVLLLLIAIYYIFFSGENTQPEGAGIPIDSTASPTEILARGSADTGAPEDLESVVADDSLTLEGRATAKVWFAIVMDGRRSETGTLDSGTVKVWRAAETFKLSLGNAGGLDLTLNERAIGTLGPLRTSIRNQIIDAEGPRKTLRRSAGTAQERRSTQRSREVRTITPTEMRTARPSQP